MILCLKELVSIRCDSTSFFNSTKTQYFIVSFFTTNWITFNYLLASHLGCCTIEYDNNNKIVLFVLLFLKNFNSSQIQAKSPSFDNLWHRDWVYWPFSWRCDEIRLFLLPFRTCLLFLWSFLVFSSISLQTLSSNGRYSRRCSFQMFACSRFHCFRCLSMAFKWPHYVFHSFLGRNPSAKPGTMKLQIFYVLLSFNCLLNTTLNWNKMSLF